MPDNQKIKLTPFPLKNIDDERSKILAAPSTSAYEVSSGTLPYGATTGPLDLPSYDRKKTYTSSLAWFSQAGLAVKTYLSDRFNNWLNTEWIDGTTGGINAITAVDVIDGKLTMDALRLINTSEDFPRYSIWRTGIYSKTTTPTNKRKTHM